MVVARRQPRNPIGWLFLVVAACLILGTDGSDYALLAYRPGRHLPFGPAALVLGELWGQGLELLIVVVLLFPDGRLSSRFWRLALRAFLGGVHGTPGGGGRGDGRRPRRAARPRRCHGRAVRR